MKQSEIVAHLDGCEANLVSCPHCLSGVPQAQLEEHAQQCRLNTRPCYVCGESIQLGALPGHLDSCGRNGRVFSMFHGTSAASAAEILREASFRPSTKGTLGAGVYVTRDLAKAQRYGPVVLEMEADVGRVCVINRKNHPLQRNWMAHGYDSAWLPAGNDVTAQGMEETCIADPQRISRIRLALCPSAGTTSS
jgi:hypothetical protein